MQQKYMLKISLTALFAALCAAGGLIIIPLPFSPVPVVLQNLFALLAGLLLGPLLGSASIALYLLAGALGLPVFSGARGGLAHLLGPSGGYLFGYLLCAFTAGLIASAPGKNRDIPLWRISLAVLCGLLIIYVPGLLRLGAVLDNGFIKTLSAGFLPFLIGDLLKGIAAVIITPRLRRSIADHLYA